jgi:hypothetical protein
LALPAKVKPPSKSVSLWETVNWIAFDDFDAETAPEPELDILRKAKWSLYEALRSGDVQATGEIIKYNGNRIERTNILADCWEFRRINWIENEAASQFESFLKIALERKTITKIWPKARQKKANTGKPPEYDEAEFLRICVLEAASMGGLPSNKSEFIDRMALLISALWQKSPGETWLKDRVREIYRLEGRVKKGRKLVHLK